LGIKVPLKLATKTTSIAKQTLIDKPLNMAKSATNYFVVSPYKWLSDKLDPFNN
jgi:hypothetical protein